MDLTQPNDLVLKEALDNWEQECLRNPNQARFGNRAAAKKCKPVKDAATELPVDPEDVNGNGEEGLDELADKDEELEESGTVAEQVVNTNTEPFNLPGYEVISNSLNSESESLNPSHLKGEKLAYRFESGWDVGVYRKPYKGKSKGYEGTSIVYFKSLKKNYFPLLTLDEYGPTKSWCLVK